MPTEFLEFLKIIGSGGVAFLCFYIYHKSSTAQLNKIIDNQSEQQRDMFEKLKSMIEQNNLQISYLQEIKTLVSANVWCPYVRKSTGYKEE